MDPALDLPYLLSESEGRIFLYKPAGMPVFPMHDGTPVPSLLDAFLALCPAQADQAWPEGFEGGLAHRLDNATSGVVLAAANPAVLAGLREDFAEGRLRKKYRFVTGRQVPWKEHKVMTALAHDRQRRSRMVAQRGPDMPHRGRWYPAETFLRRRGPNEWEAVITTGVMHQVRVHAASVGLPLLGDRLYGGGSLPSGLVLPSDVPFLLHHEGIKGSDWASPRLDPPAWWAAVALAGSYVGD